MSFRYAITVTVPESSIAAAVMTAELSLVICVWERQNGAARIAAAMDMRYARAVWEIHI